MSIYQHFRPDEREFIDQVLNWKNYVEQTYSPKLTDFLDPREQLILSTIVGVKQEIKLSFFGGTSHTERKRAFLYPDYFECTEEEFQVGLFEIDYPKKFVTLTHPQVLGSLMSLGLSRGKFGDILINDDRVQFFVAKEVEDYIRLQLDSIGKAKVALKLLKNSEAAVSKDVWSEFTTTSSSLRLDTIVSAIFNLSRQKSQVYITQGQVKVNWRMIEVTTFECGEGDILSVRGYGRAKIMSIEGKTKKDKWKITAGKLK